MVESTHKGIKIPRMTAPAVEVGDPEQELWEELQQFANDPLGYVLYVFPWGEEGTAL